MPRIYTESRNIDCCRDCPNCKIDYPDRMAINTHHVCSALGGINIINLYYVREHGWPPIPECCPLPRVPNA